ncbi:MAG: hypothetical protein LRY76_02445 [Alphaproteobacteria bacterium]|nr:hypothetical protein [Alphaproteobacteria bacterium]
MSKKPFLSRFILLASATVFIFVGCDSGNAQTEEAKLEELCKTLSEQEGVEYKVISGLVLSTKMHRPPPADCFEGPCPDAGMWGFGAYMQGIDAHQNSKFSVYAPRDTRENLLARQPIMVEGKKYQLCVTGPYQEVIHPEQSFYRFQHYETIQEID